MISIKILETYRIDRYNWKELLEFFSEVFVHTFLQERGFDAFEVMNHAILDLLGHEIQILITGSIGPSEKNTLNCFQNFSFIPFFRNDF